LYTQEEEEELWGPWPDTNKLFLGSPCYWDKKLVNPRRRRRRRRTLGALA
jgi:hypothetical protein